MSKRPYMPLYIADYRVDTTHLTTEQHGAYLLLIMAMWTAGGELPDDDRATARIVGLSLKRWRAIGGPVLALFQHAKQMLQHKRVSRELEALRKLSQVRAAAGKIGGKNKSGVNESSNLEGDSSPLASPGDAAKPLKNGHAGEAIASAGARARTSRGRALLQTPDSIPKRDSYESLAHEDVRRTRKRGDSEFATWWSRYPVKRGKGQAERAFHAARKIASLQELLDGVARYKREKLPDRAWRYPATWLSGKGWLDEAEPEPVTQRRASTGPPRWRDEAEEQRQRDSDAVDRAIAAAGGARKHG